MSTLGYLWVGNLLCESEGVMENEKLVTLADNPQGLEDVSAICVISEENHKEVLKGAKSFTRTLEVTYGGFKGELTFSYWWVHEGGLFYCYCSQYRITRTNEDGGHKANLHFSFGGVQWWGNDSPDAMWQDGQWHSYSRGGWIAANKLAIVYVKFVFDRSGSWDPAADGYSICLYPL